MKACETSDKRINVLLAILSMFRLPDHVVETILTLVQRHDRPTTSAFNPGMPEDGPPRSIGDVARMFHKRSLLRADILGHGLVSDAAWNMMLALFADAELGRTVSVSSACLASGAPATTALRYLEALERAGHITRRDDPMDHRRVLIQLSPASHDLMARTIRGFCVAPPRDGNLEQAA